MAMRLRPSRRKRPGGFSLVMLTATSASVVSVVTIALIVLFSLKNMIGSDITEQRPVPFRERQTDHYCNVYNFKQMGFFMVGLNRWV